ncbi:hypothetical protein E4U27_000302 [Claviceps purpurea]|nr:hypothetical protein E4U27_000302 [Claviceps purpurea]
MVRFEAQLAKADELDVADRDKIELLQMTLHTGVDARCRTANIPEDDYPQKFATVGDTDGKLQYMEQRARGAYIAF